MAEDPKKIIRTALKVKFGRTADDQFHKRLFMNGVFFAVRRMDGGKQAIVDAGYENHTED